MSRPDISYARFEVPRWAELVDVEYSEHREVHPRLLPMMQELASGLLAHLDPGVSIERGEVDHRSRDSSWPHFDALEQRMDAAGWWARLGTTYTYLNPRDGEGVDVRVEVFPEPMGGPTLRLSNEHLFGGSARSFSLSAVRWDDDVAGLFEAVGRILGEAFGCEARRVED